MKGSGAERRGELGEERKRERGRGEGEIHKEEEEMETERRQRETYGEKRDRQTDGGGEERGSEGGTEPQKQKDTPIEGRNSKTTGNSAATLQNWDNRIFMLIHNVSLDGTMRRFALKRGSSPKAS